MSRKRAWRPSVLHVEDDVPTQQLRAEILRRAACAVSNAGTVREAILAAAGEHDLRTP